MRDTNELPFIDLDSFKFDENEMKFDRFIYFSLVTLTNEFSQLNLWLTDSLDKMSEAVSVWMNIE